MKYLKSASLRKAVNVTVGEALYAGHIVTLEWRTTHSTADHVQRKYRYLVIKTSPTRKGNAIIYLHLAFNQDGTVGGRFAATPALNPDQDVTLMKGFSGRWRNQRGRKGLNVKRPDGRKLAIALA